MTDQKIFNVLALENILVALTREIGDGPCFLYIEFSWIGVPYLSAFAFWKIEFEKSSWSNLIFTACVACKIQVQNRQKIKFIQLDFQTQFFKNLVQINMGYATSFDE
jgi:uncharacterized protein (DUF983 family)